MVYYAVKKGREPGIYETWAQCQKQTSGFSGAQFHKFETIEECQEYINSSPDHSILNDEIDKDLYKPENFKYPIAFVDGSNNKKTKAVGYGVILQESLDSDQVELSGLVDEKYWFSNNVSGEVQSAIEAIQFAIESKWSSLTIYYDYSGIELWGTFIWGSKLEHVQEYIKLCKWCKENGIELSFVKIPSHTKVPLNDRVDYLAGKACGVF